jgi:transposase
MVYSFDLKKLVIDNYKLKNMNRSQIINIFKICNGSLYNWLNKHKNNELHASTKNKHQSKKSKITSEIKCFIREYVIKKINFNRFELMEKINKKYNVIIKKSSIYKIIKKFKIKKKKIYKRINYLSDKKKQILTNQFKNKIKKISLSQIISIDETSIDSHISHNYGWALKGEKIEIIKKYQRKRYSVICAISDNKILNIKIIDGTCNATIYTEFIKETIEKNTKEIQKQYLLMDNARIHHSRIFKEMIKKEDKYETIYNAAYSPENNPIEKVFSKIKNSLKNKNLDNINLKDNIIRAFGTINKKDLKNFYNKSLSF